MKLRFLGHSAFLLEFGGKSLLFDPFISGNPEASKIDLNTLHPDYILISHGHGDHLMDTEQIAKANSSFIISTYEIVSWFEQKGLKGHGMNTGGKFKFDFGFVKLVNAIHSSQLPDGSYGANPVGFVIWNDKECIYFAGDTALTMDMKIIPMTCPKLTVAILPIGDNFTMGYEDAIIASDWIQCNKIIACHFNTFPAIQVDNDKVKNSFNQKGKNIILPNIGQDIIL